MRTRTHSVTVKSFSHAGVISVRVLSWFSYLVLREPHSSDLIQLGEAVGKILQPGHTRQKRS